MKNWKQSFLIVVNVVLLSLPTDMLGQAGKTGGTTNKSTKSKSLPTKIDKIIIDGKILQKSATVQKQIEKKKRDTGDLKTALWKIEGNGKYDEHVSVLIEMAHRYDHINQLTRLFIDSQEQLMKNTESRTLVGAVSDFVLAVGTQKNLNSRLRALGRNTASLLYTVDATLRAQLQQERDPMSENHLAEVLSIITNDIRTQEVYPEEAIAKKIQMIEVEKENGSNDCFDSRGMTKVIASDNGKFRPVCPPLE